MSKWVRLDGTKIVQTINNPKPINIDGVQHPSSIFTLWSDEELSKLNIYCVSVREPKNVDKETEIVREEPVKIINGKAIIERRVEPKDISVQKPLVKSEAESTAKSLLNQHIQEVVESLETGTELDEKIKTYRSEVRKTLALKLEKIGQSVNMRQLVDVKNIQWPTLEE